MLNSISAIFGVLWMQCSVMRAWILDALLLNRRSSAKHLAKKPSRSEMLGNAGLQIDPAQIALISYTGTMICGWWLGALVVNIAF